MIRYTAGLSKHVGSIEIYVRCTGTRALRVAASHEVSERVRFDLHYLTNWAFSSISTSPS